MSTSKREKCGNCRFWMKRTDHAAGGGYCRRYPPFFPSGLHVHENLSRIARADHRFEIALSSGFLNDAWPNVHQQSWCGEYQSLGRRA